jgi:XTP/dITP diphosphohydrolase
MPVIDLIFATTNRAKLAQLAFVIGHLNAPIRLISAVDHYGDAAAYEEKGKDAAMIAWRGAQEVSQRLGVPVIAEDTTFHVEVMGNAPGVLAGSFLREHGRKGILSRIGDTGKRYAWITSALCWANPEGDTQTWMQIVPGHIARREWLGKGMPEWIAPSSENPLGGGYNAIFIPRGDTRTLAEIPPKEALLISYREPNFCALLYFLRDRAARGISNPFAARPTDGD